VSLIKKPVNAATLFSKPDELKGRTEEWILVTEPSGGSDASVYSIAAHV
jgi:hypothetical protein